MSDEIRAVLSPTDRPELGLVAISFPIPDEEYGPTIERLEMLGMGDALRQDCRVDDLDSRYSILRRLEGTSVTVDELDYLSKRLERFNGYEATQFQASACELGISNVQDFISLTFCCQQATVITDFSDLEKIGKDHVMIQNGGGMRVDEYQAVDGRKEALQLIGSGSGTITPYGVVYNNGMALEQVYDGRCFPAYLYTMPLLMLEVTSDQRTEYFYLPAPEYQIQRALLRAGVKSTEDAPVQVVMDGLPGEISSILDLGHLKVPDLNALNQLCWSLEQTQTGAVEPEMGQLMM